MDFDTEKFILAVKQRPSIWNSKSSEYSDRNLKQRQWGEIVNEYGGGDLSKEEKKTLGQTLQKKWRNIRDNFVKDLKRKGNKSGSVAKGKSQYMFFNNLLFLKDTISVNCTDVRYIQNEEDSGGSYQEPSSAPKRKKNRKKLEVGSQLLVLNKKIKKRKNEDDGDRLFFLSLVKDFKKVPEHLRLQTKLDIIKVINDAQFHEYQNISGDYQRQSNYIYGPVRDYNATNNSSPTKNHHRTTEQRIQSPIFKTERREVTPSHSPIPLNYSESVESSIFQDSKESI